jgi:hypothetical protein
LFEAQASSDIASLIPFPVKRKGEKNCGFF